MIAPLPRKHVYQFTHRILPRTMLTEVDASWAALDGDDAAAWLAQQWETAASMVDPEDRLDVPEMRIEAREDLPGDWTARLLLLPPPEGATEPHAIAFLRRGSEARYVVVEQSPTVDEHHVVAEWVFKGADRDRKRLAAVETGDIDAALEAIRPHLELPPDEERIPRSRVGCLMLMLPVGASLFIIAMYIAMIVIGALGSTPTGDRVRIAFATCADAMPLIEARVDAMGLGEPAFQREEGRLLVTATLPDKPDVAASIPRTLAAPGRFEIRTEDSNEVVIDPTHIVEVNLTLERLGDPLTIIRLSQEGGRILREHMEDNRGGAIVVYIDDELIVTRMNEPAVLEGVIDLRPHQETREADIEVAAERRVRVGFGPLPCVATVDSIETLAP